MNGRRVCQLLLVLAAFGASGAALAGRGGWGGGGGGFYHGGGGGWGGGGWHGGGWHGGGWHGGGWHGGGWHGGGWGGHGFHHGGHCCRGSIGLFFGTGFVYGYPYPYYGYPYPYYYPGYYPYWPTAVGWSSSSTQYMEQDQDGQADMGGGDVPQAAYWYHCGKPEGYYPYVKTCPGGWQKVPAQPPPGS
jgi:hypothetical protein